MKKLTFLLSLSLFAFSVVVTGCGGSAAEYNEPKQVQYEKERTYNIAFDLVWQNIIDWLSSHNTPIKTLDKSSGIIASDYNLSTSGGAYLNCGSVKHGQENAIGIEVTHLRYENQKGNFNVLVKKIDENNTKVTVNFFGESQLNQYNNSNQLVFSQVVTCYSNGQLEKEILNNIK